MRKRQLNMKNKTMSGYRSVTSCFSGLASFCRFVEKTGFFHGKNRPGKNSFCGWKKPPGKNPAKLALQTFTRWKK
jgi:hypothetical protein